MRSREWIERLTGRKRKSRLERAADAIAQAAERTLARAETSLHAGEWARRLTGRPRKSTLARAGEAISRSAQRTVARAEETFGRMSLPELAARPAARRERPAPRGVVIRVPAGTPVSTTDREVRIGSSRSRR